MKRACCFLICLVLLAPFCFTAFGDDGGIELPPDPLDPFIDVEEGKWYTDAVYWCYDRGYMAGISEEVFGVDAPLTRAMFVTLLSRVDGADLSGYTKDTDGLPFSDVSGGAYYIRPLKWAYEHGYTSGVGGGLFGTDDPVTREQLAVFLKVYAASAGCDVSASASLAGYRDAGAVSGWAESSVRWAVASGMISGVSRTELAPKTVASRAQIALIIRNFCVNVLSGS